VTRFLVTGAYGCIGAWVVHELVGAGLPVVTFDLSSEARRVRLLLDDETVAAIPHVVGDITDLAAVERAVDEHGITNIVHLAALQVPFCRADPPLGARVNVVGTINVFEAVKRRELGTTLAYASSAAVYDSASEIAPTTHYGVYKLANEGTAQVYWRDDGIASLGLRPFCVYGPGRDQGMTSTPTQAMLAAVRREPYRISFGGRTQFHYAPDVARAFIAAARRSPEEASVYNLGGPDVHVREVVSAIEAAAPDAAGLIELDDVPLPFPERLPEPTLDLELTPLADGVRETVDLFRAAT
jgi:UDP-glucuronate 4-epimerase